MDKVLKDVNVPRNTFVSAAMDFIQFQREHVSREEKRFLPMVEEFLNAEDWADIALRIMDVEDPLANAEDDRYFEDLRCAIMGWKAEHVDERVM